MSNRPCLNENCNSYGHPHPNCRCYGDFSEGGEAGHFCSKSQMHHGDCQYFADGGEVEPAPGSLGGINPQHVTSGHIANDGVLGILKLDKDKDLKKYEKSAAKGMKRIKQDIEGAFQGRRQQPMDRAKQREAIDDWISKGGVDTSLREEIYKQNGDGQPSEKANDFANKPLLSQNPIESAYPDHNIVLQSAKGRVSSYLKNLKPNGLGPRLPFDKYPDDTEQKKHYDEALGIADHPLSVLGEISKGTLMGRHLDHLSNMYPELADTMKQKIAERMVQAQLAEEKPHHKIRQGLSMFMGSPLSGEFKPQNIAAAQSVFAPQQPAPPAQGGGGKAKSSTKNLTNADKAYLTQSQAVGMHEQSKS